MFVPLLTPPVQGHGALPLLLQGGHGALPLLLQQRTL